MSARPGSEGVARKDARMASAIAADLRKAIPDNPHLAVLLDEAARRMSVTGAAETFLDTCALLERGRPFANTPAESSPPALPAGASRESKPANLPDSPSSHTAQEKPPYWLKDDLRSDT